MDILEKSRPTSLQSSRICRFCLSQSGVMSPIFEQDETSSLPLSSKIMAFISIQIFANDGLPSLICHRCLYLAEKSYEFKTQCEATDAMLHKYISSVDDTGQVEFPLKQENMDSRDLSQLQQMTRLFCSNNSYYNDSPFKRKRGRPRKEENMIFYSNPLQTLADSRNNIPVPENEIKIVDGIESVVTVVDPRSEMLSNSEDENRSEPNDVNDNPVEPEPQVSLKNLMEVKLDALAVAKAKAKKYMGVVFGVDENGLKTRRHLCKGCGKTFNHCSDLRKHVLVHTGERPFHCQICTKNFSRSTNLNKHMKVHAGQKPFVCINCPKSFTTKGDLQRHSIIHSGIKPFSCHLCQHSFSRKDKLTRHLKLHETGHTLNKMNFKCTFCTEVYHSKVELNQHLDVCHKIETMNLLQNGREGGLTPDNLTMEQNFKPGSTENLEKSENGEVESMVISLDPFQMDDERIDPSPPPNWQQRNKSIMKDIESDENKGTTISEKIQFSLGSAITVTAIPKTTKQGDTQNTSEAAKSMCQCSICHRKFADATSLNTHVAKAHEATRPHKCLVCEKSFMRRRELLRHENVHTGLKPFKCPTCEKAFSRKDKLVRHEKIHNGVRNYACNSCPATFLRKDELNSHHQKFHSNDKLFTCLICTISFKSRQELMRHEQIHSTYTCEICFNVFETAEMLEQHMFIHKDDSQTGDKWAQNHDSDLSEPLTEDEEDDVNFSINQSANSVEIL